MTFTPEDFNALYSTYPNGDGFIDCLNKLEHYCNTFEDCHKCPLYYMTPSDALIFILNNTPEYPHDKTFFIGVEDDIIKTLYYNENLSIWEEKYTWDN